MYRSERSRIQKGKSPNRSIHRNHNGGMTLSMAGVPGERAELSVAPARPVLRVTCHARAVTFALCITHLHQGEGLGRGMPKPQ